MSNDSLSDNVQARKDAAEIIEFIGDKSVKFWTVLGAMVHDKIPKVPDAVERHPPMTEQEAIQFEAEDIPFGKHKGNAVGEVPVDYILWLTEGNEFDKDLRRYVRSKRFQMRQEDD